MKEESDCELKEIYKCIKIEEPIDSDIANCPFIPKYIHDKNLPQDQQYQLYFGPANVFMFLTFFYSVYERVLKAQQLVRSKVEQDFLDDFS